MPGVLLMKNRVGMAWMEFMTIFVTTFNIESMGFAMLKGPIYGQPILGQCITIIILCMHVLYNSFKLST